jgi:hypothetical protein
MIDDKNATMPDVFVLPNTDDLRWAWRLFILERIKSLPKGADYPSVQDIDTEFDKWLAERDLAASEYGFTYACEYGFAR